MKGAGRGGGREESVKSLGWGKDVGRREKDRRDEEDRQDEDRMGWEVGEVWMGWGYRKG